MKKVLVIQNNDSLKTFDKILSKDEFEIFYSHNINDGLEISIRYLPDLILLLINNIEDDIAVISKITELEKTSCIPLIVISSKSSFRELRRVMELGADDYLPEEMLGEHLLNSINKRIKKIDKIKTKISNRINSFESENNEGKRNDHILVKIGNKLKLVKFTEIVCITALKEYSKITTNDNSKIIIRKSLKNWTNLLPAKLFLQIHRSTIININFIDKIVKTNDRTYTVHLTHIAETFDFSHRYANIMRQTFPT
ncbi:MAG TPA: response regulator transcription factor [Ignavibacteriaceae bacterium]|nr:response regulator transcription factor [Ignavibacteriaceae bacterium]